LIGVKIIIDFVAASVCIFEILNIVAP